MCILSYNIILYIYISLSSYWNIPIYNNKECSLQYATVLTRYNLIIQTYNPKFIVYNITLINI